MNLLNGVKDAKIIKKQAVPKKKKFKNLYVFFRKIGANTRATLIKQQNSCFVQIILDNHYNYDKIRQKLGYKQSSYYWS